MARTESGGYMKILTAKWMVALIGGLAYLATTLVCFSTARFTRPQTAADAAGADGGIVESWNFKNPELDQMIEELKSERETLVTREQQLKDLEVRLTNERQEIAVVTQMVSR